MESILTINNMTHYFGGLKAVSNFNLKLPKGVLWGIIGPNGAGKTTVFNLISGIYIPTTGNINFQNDDITRYLPHEVACRGVGRTFQTIRLFGNLSALDNVRIGCHLGCKGNFIQAITRNSGHLKEEKRIRDKSLELLDLMRLKHRAEILARNLPYGEQRRLEIARTLASDPTMLLLDEPAAGMNPREVDELIDLIRKVKSDLNLTLLIIEHQMRFVMKICERIKVMDFGETIAEGTPVEIQNNPVVIEAYLGKGRTVNA